MFNAGSSIFTRRSIKTVLVVLIILTLQGCITGVKSVVTQAKFLEKAELHKKTNLGATQKEIIALHGEPASTFENSKGNAALLLYCDYGFSDSQFYGYFVSDDFGYYDGLVLSEIDFDRQPLDAKGANTKGVWEDNTVPLQLNCYHNIKVNWSLAPPPPEFPLGWEKTEYNIDKLRVVTLTRTSSECDEGAHHKIVLEGEISPDSSFALERLLGRLTPCTIGPGNEANIVVSMKSTGGLLKDGYALGQTFRKNHVEVVVEDGDICASSCAVAFLGGSRRVVEDKGHIMFHAPYSTGRNEYGQRAIDCNIGKDALGELLSYYKTMTDTETGERIFERTMWYCSSEDGWLVTGGAAAELYGIATEG